MPLTTVSKRMDWNRSNACCPPGSSAYTTGSGELLRSCCAMSRAPCTGTYVS